MNINDYRQITARFDSQATCGHTIKRGDRIGWNPRSKQTRCAECWEAWNLENAAAADDERWYAGQHGGGA